MRVDPIGVGSIADKAGAWGSLLSAMGCAVCFPAIALLGANVGLGFLSEYESVLVTWFLPFFATLSLVANGLSWYSHRRLMRALLGMLGPAMVLGALFLIPEHAIAVAVLYVGLTAMVLIGVWDLLYPVRRLCDVEPQDGRSGA